MSHHTPGVWRKEAMTEDAAFHEDLRSRVARQQYMDRRMGDVPSLYRNLMPFSYKLRVLWEAEKAVRRQLEADLQFCASPWRRIGPPCNLLDNEGVTGYELLEIGLGESISVGMPDAVKPGFEDHPEVIAARKAAKVRADKVKTAE
jgi:hypothetical protein